MASRFGLVFIVLGCAVLAFLAGAVAPGAVGQSVTGAVASVRQQLQALVPGSAASAPAAVPTLPASSPTVAIASAGSGAAAPVVAPSASAPAGAASVTAPAASTGESAAPAPAATTAATSVPMGSILLPTLPPATGTYGLQAGQFASLQSANQLAAGFRGQGVSSTVIPVTDVTGTLWAVVAIGSFPSAAEALSQRTYLANKLGLPHALPPVLIPPSKPSP